MLDEITVMYIYKEDESELEDIIKKHDCFEFCEIEKHGNIRLIDVAIADDVAQVSKGSWKSRY